MLTHGTQQDTGAAGRQSRAAVPHGEVGRDRPRHPAGLGGRRHPVAARLSRARQPRAGRGAGADGHAGQRAEGPTAKLILQTKTDGPLDFLVADFESPGKVRGYANFDKGNAALADTRGRGDQGALLGSGHVAMTIDPGGGRDSYQGIVRARQRAAGRRRRTPISASPSSCRPSSAWRWRGTTGPPRAAARAPGTGAPAA